IGKHSAIFTRICRGKRVLQTRGNDTAMGAHGNLLARIDYKLRLLKHHLVDVAPAPVFSRLEGLDNRVVGRVEMLRRVLVLRGVATSDMPANQALAQEIGRASCRERE